MYGLRTPSLHPELATLTTPIRPTAFRTLYHEPYFTSF